MNKAESIIREFNGKALVAVENNYMVFIEDCKDLNGKLYRIEYRSTPDGEKSIAYCIKNPWGDKNGKEKYEKGHVAEDGFLCLGPKHTDKSLQNSPYHLKYVIERVRYWCIGFSVLKETGSFPNP